MENALRDVSNGELGLREAARGYGISPTTLKRRLDGKNKIATGSRKHDGRPPVFSMEMENELATHVLKMEEMMFGFTRKEVRQLAFQLAERNAIEHVFRRSSGMAGKDWLRRFLKRHLEISISDPQQTTIDRAKAFNRQNVGHFFNLLEEVMDRNQFDATTVYNMDETAITTVQNNPMKILAKKGKRHIGRMSSAERGCLTTVACCFGAAGQYIPPYFLFKCRNKSEHSFAISSTRWKTTRSSTQF